MSDTLVVEGKEIAPVEAPLKFGDKPEGVEDAERRARKPPEEGPCKHCGQRARLNRLKLCYPCWVLLEIMDKEKAAGREWIPGDPHPAWCRCELPNGCATKARRN